MSSPYIILGSGSPRRRELLQLLNIPFEVLLPTQLVDETPLPHEQPDALVQRLSQLKNEAVAATCPPPHAHSAIILTADTTVALRSVILNKPQDEIEAEAMLLSLREQPHFVYTSMTLRQGVQGQPVTLLHTSQVWMRPYSMAEIKAYIVTGDPLDKAGGYGIQHATFAPVARFEGCFASIMGLPLAQLANQLRQWGVEVAPVAPLCQVYIHGTCCQI